jgi:hypothetical protein
VFDWNDQNYKLTIEANSEVEKGSNKIILTLPNGEVKTYASNWYFNQNDLKTNGNKIFILRICNRITFYCPSSVSKMADT